MLLWQSIGIGQVLADFEIKSDQLEKSGIGASLVPILCSSSSVFTVAFCSQNFIRFFFPLGERLSTMTSPPVNCSPWMPVLNVSQIKARARE